MRFFFLALITVSAMSATAQSVPAAIYTDPPVDRAHPAGMAVLHIPSHGVLINGLVYSPSGAGPHPTLVICHGLPGNEKNLDLAQAVRRAGWNAVTFNYRGSWGSPGFTVLRRIWTMQTPYWRICGTPRILRAWESTRSG